jgi:hypothetical protein
VGAEESHSQIWQRFCTRQEIVSRGVPLLASDGLAVQTRGIGRPARRDVLCRSSRMDELVREQVALLIADWELGVYDGLIYMMYWLDGDQVIPLYIGKTETIGRNGGLSANIRSLTTDTSKFARWGDNYAYHIGDLSAVVLGHDPSKYADKYLDWAERLFVCYPAESPALKRPTFFWCKAWKPEEVGIWEAFGPTRLTFLEYLMIGVASSAFPEQLLNREGQSRSIS